MPTIESFEMLYTYQRDLLTQKVQLAVIETYLTFLDKDSEEWRIVQKLYEDYLKIIKEKTELIRLYLDNHKLSSNQTFEIFLITPNNNVADKMYSYINSLIKGDNFIFDWLEHKAVKGSKIATFFKFLKIQTICYKKNNKKSIDIRTKMSII